MKDKNTIDTKEIRKQAEKLFGLIVEPLEELGDDTIAEALAEQMGDYLKTAKGFDLLQYSFALAQTKDEQAIMDINRAISFIHDEGLYNLYRLAANAKECADLIEGDPKDHHKIRFRVREIKETAPAILEHIQSEWWFRAKCYGREIRQLKDKG